MLIRSLPRVVATGTVALRPATATRRAVVSIRRGALLGSETFRRHSSNMAYAIPQFNYHESGTASLWLQQKGVEYGLVVMQRLGIKEWDADLLKHMASVRGQMGDMEAARDLLQTVITIQTEAFGTEIHAEVADTVSRLVGALGLLGQHREATAMLERLQVIQTGLAGGSERNIDVICTMRDVARGKGSIGEHQEMAAILERVLKIQEAMHGTEEHREVIKTLLLLASAHAAMNNLEALRSVMDRVVKIHSARWKGWGDKLLSFPLFHIQARVAGEAGDVDSKRRLLETLLYRQQEEYGARGAFDVIDVMVDLAEALVQLGDTTAARKLALRAVEMKDQLRVPDIIWAGSQVKLAGVWGGLGELGKKKEMLEEVLQVQIGYNGSSNHEQVIITKLELADVARQMGDHKREEELRARIASIRESLASKGTVCKAGAETSASRLVLLAIAIESFADIYF